MAGGTVAVNSCQNGISVAVERKSHNLLNVSASFALEPAALSGARVVNHLSGFNRLGKAFAVGPSQHQNILGLRVLRDDRHKARFVKFNGVDV